MGIKTYILLLLTSPFIPCSCTKNNSDNEKSLPVVDTKTTVDFSNIDKNVLGVWQDDLRPEIIYRIRQKDDGNYVIDIGEADDMSKWLEMFKLREEYKNTFRVFFDIEGEDYFIIDHRNGDLVVGDNYGYIATWKPFR